jgi:hypothetical protein
MEFKQKVIYIISHENWGNMMMSKHHYAIELSKMGNEVYFINHPDKKHELRRGEIKIEATQYENLMVVKHRFFHPYFFKSKYTKIYNYLTKYHINNIIRATGKKPDVVWSFDTGNTLPIKYFSCKYHKIYMPVDGPFGTRHEVEAADTANIIISVTNRILETYKNIDVPKYQINHGVASVFINNDMKTQNNNKIKVGYSGSLIRSDLDNETFLAIIDAYPNIGFEFWGEIDPNTSNIHLSQDVEQSTLHFIESLKNAPNVVLHGAVDSITLATGLKKVDVLLICYNIKNDQNHHKVLEYLGTGKVIVSSYMSSYENMESNLIEMLGNSEGNQGFLELFGKVITHINTYNSIENQQFRINHAKQFTYSSQIEKISKFLLG